MRDWQELGTKLGAGTDEAVLTWDELEKLVGPLPPSASRYRAWWSGDRVDVRAWEAAGYRLTRLELGRQVSFRRVSAADVNEIPRGTTSDVGRVDTSAQTADLLLVTCVKSKKGRPAPAKDLYTSPLFKKQRAYAEASGMRWFILSAEHGLVQPDEWLAPYERYLPDTPPAYQRAWGRFVAERLELLQGSLEGLRVEVHASADYVRAIRRPLEDKGAALETPLEGLTQGGRLRWYSQQGEPVEPAALDAPSRPDNAEIASLLSALLDDARALTPDELLRRRPAALSSPGLYSWWVDAAGASQLTKGLGLAVSSGLIYAGSAGATRWPSGQRSTNTLEQRIIDMHLGGSHQFSTFRRTLGALLANGPNAVDFDEGQLTRWMHEHLRVITVPSDDPDTLKDLESAVLRRLDPPLNLQEMERSPRRVHLRELRRSFAAARRPNG
jgi:hypothetical protein